MTFKDNQFSPFGNLQKVLHLFTGIAYNSQVKAMFLINVTISLWGLGIYGDVGTRPDKKSLSPIFRN